MFKGNASGAATATVPVELGHPDIDMHLNLEVQRELTDVTPCPLVRNADERVVFNYMALQAEYEAEMARIRAGCQAMIGRIESKRKALDYMRGLEVRQATERLLAGKRVKSVKTPHGTVGFRTAPERLIVEDEAALVDAVKAGNLPSTFIRVVTKTSESIDKAALNNHYQSTGEIPEGCLVEAAHEAFYTKSE